MKILFVRHGEKVEEKTKSPLTKKGKKQSGYLARFLKKESIDEFFCSNLIRAKETSEPVSKLIKLKPQIVKALNEYDLAIFKNKNANHPERKRFNELKKFLEEITKEPKKEKKILIISHGYTNRLILSHFLKLDDKKMLPFMQDETGIDEIYWNEKHKNWRLLRWNNVEHLPKRLRTR